MVQSNKLEQLLKQNLAAISDTNADDWFVVSRARHGMEQVFRQLAEQAGQGAVITQSFTCVTAINPIIAAGLTPVYCDINKETFSIEVNNLGKLLDDETRAVVVQHSFGIPADMVGIKKQLKFSGSPLLIEDSAHRLGYIFKSKDEPLADISVHSFGSEKFLSTNFGGALWLNPNMANKVLRDNLANVLSDLPKTSIIVNLRVWLYPWINGGLNRLPAYLSKICRRLFVAIGLFRSPIVPKEQRAINYEECQRPRNSQLKKILANLAGYADNIKHRTDLTQIYHDTLAKNAYGLEISSLLEKDDIPCLRFPLLAKSSVEAERLFSELRERGMYVGKWYRPLFFPGVNDYSAYKYRQGSCPVAEDVSDRIINLPTNLNTSVKTAKGIANALIN